MAGMDIPSNTAPLCINAAMVVPRDFFLKWYTCVQHLDLQDHCSAPELQFPGWSASPCPPTFEQNTSRAGKLTKLTGRRVVSAALLSA